MIDLVSTLADQIIALINTKPRSPTKAEIEDVVRPVCTALQTLQDAEALSSYPRGLVRFETDGCGGGGGKAWSSAFVTDHMNYEAAKNCTSVRGRHVWEAKTDRCVFCNVPRARRPNAC